MLLLLFLLLSLQLIVPTTCFTAVTHQPRNKDHVPASSSSSFQTSCLQAKKNVKKTGDDGLDWYDSVEEGASPDQVFWGEMERQRLQNQVEFGGGGAVMDPVAAMGAASSSNSMGSSGMSSSSSSQSASSSNNNNNNPTISSLPTSPFQQKPPTMDETKSAEATLQEYTLFMVSDNWLDDELVAAMTAPEDDELTMTPEEQAEVLEQQLEELDDHGAANPFWMAGDEPWDIWQGNSVDGDQNQPPPTNANDNNPNMFQVDPNKGTLLLFLKSNQVKYG